MRVERLITHRFPIQDGLKAYDLILENREPYIGVVLTYPQEVAAAAAAGRTIRWERPPAITHAATPLVTGLIGGGKFTKNILMPALKKVSGGCGRPRKPLHETRNRITFCGYA